MGSIPRTEANKDFAPTYAPVGGRASIPPGRESILQAATKRALTKQELWQGYAGEHVPGYGTQWDEAHVRFITAAFRTDLDAQYVSDHSHTEADPNFKLAENGR